MRLLAMFASKLNILYSRRILETHDLPYPSSHTSSVIMEIVYGYNVDPNGDPFVAMVEQALEGARIIGNEGIFLVDYIPGLKYLPREFLFISPSEGSH